MANMVNEELICPKCGNITLDNQNCIYCDICYRWIHLKCSGFTLKRFVELGNNPSLDWFCKSCLEENLPFQSLTDDKFLKLIVTAKEKPDPPTNFETCDQYYNCGALSCLSTVYSWKVRSPHGTTTY